MKAITFSLLTLLIFGTHTGCKKDKTTEPEVKNIPVVSLSFSVGGNSLAFDTIKYTNAAGNNYSVTNLQCYLSAFEFENSAGVVYKYTDVIYVDAKNDTNKSFSFPTLPLGNYVRLNFLIGLDSIHNTENALPITVENDNMTWPSIMGGGYHFLKLEGNFMDLSQTYGYAMHLGRNENCVAVSITKNFTLSQESNILKLNMNINEWFQNPHIYDFNVDGNYTMSNSAAMTKLSQNGADVFILN